jgi:hypothetical protein
MKKRCRDFGAASSFLQLKLFFDWQNSFAVKPVPNDFFEVYQRNIKAVKDCNKLFGMFFTAPDRKFIAYSAANCSDDKPVLHRPVAVGFIKAIGWF